MVTREPPRVPKPASKNPWYVLATIHGEQAEEGWSGEVAAKNRQIWNGWSCGHLPKAKRAELAKLAKLDEAALDAWSEKERAHVEKVFATGRGKGMTLPGPEAAVDFQGYAFLNTTEHWRRRLELRGDFTGDDLRRLARSSRDAKQVRRLLALAAICDGGTRTEAARIGGVGLQIVRDGWYASMPKARTG